MPLPLEGPLAPLDALFNDAINLDDRQLGRECRRLAEKIRELPRRTEGATEIMLILAAASYRLNPRPAQKSGGPLFVGHQAATPPQPTSEAPRKKG